MNAFYVPDLAGMIYAMPSMQTQLNAVINKPGVYKGMSSHYSGSGFAGMTFKFHGLSEEGFEQWVEKARAGGKVLSREAYLELAKPSEREPVALFASVDDSLYQRVLNLCVAAGQACMHEVMAKDARRNRAHVADVALTAALNQSVCTASESFDLLSN